MSDAPGSSPQPDIDAVLHTVTAALDYPMVIVTATVGTERSGCLVGFFSQCSMDPVRFAVWVSKVNHTFGVAVRAPALAVHLPAVDQRDLAELFGATTDDAVDKFERCRWHEGPAGTTILDDCTRWFAGPVLRRDDGGDHMGFLVQPTHGAAGPWPGQLGFQQARGIDPGHPA